LNCDRRFVETHPSRARQSTKHGRTGRRCVSTLGEVQGAEWQKVIDRATFQSFSCETAIAVASLATELIRSKTAEKALALKTEELAGELGPLPPMKIHCTQLVEGALRSALEPEKAEGKPVAATNAPTLLDSFPNPRTVA
jgi:hypothetical protein